MRKITLFLMSLFLTVGAMAQHYKVGQAVTNVTTGYYVVVGTFNSNTTGPVYYDAGLTDCKYRLDSDKSINENDILTDANYVWYVENNGTTITLKNVQDNVYFVKDNARNQNFKGTETANLYLEKVTESADDKRYYLHLEEQNIGYIHCNQPGGDPCLSYWDASGESGTCVRFEFYAVKQEVFVSELSDFNPLKCYTVSTPSRGGWSVNENKDNFCSTNDNEFGTTVDAIKKQNQFAVLTIDNENYYLFSVYANKFVKADRSLVEGPGDAINFGDASEEGAGRVLVSFKDYTGKYINLNGEMQMIINDWGDGYNGYSTRDEIDGGNAVKFVEVGDFDPSEAFAMLAGDKSELLLAITEANELLKKVADYGLIKDKIDIYGKISSNAGHNTTDGNATGYVDGQGIAGLTDNNPETYFHSRWKGTVVNEAHYLQIDLGEGNNLSDFCFEYAVRKTGDSNRTSPAPTKIEIRVSENGTDFGNPVVTLTKDADKLPGHTDLGATLWSSNIISANKEIRYIRLTVTDSQGPNANTWEGQKFFAMGTLNLYSTKYTDDYTVAKDEYKDKITADQVSAAVNALKAANEVFNNTAATDDDINNATSGLNEALVVFKEASISHTLEVTAAGYATLYLDFAAAIPTNVEAYIVKANDINKDFVTLTQVTGVLPAKTGIIVKAGKGNYTFAYSTEDAESDFTGNLLKGSVSDEYIQGEAYVLANINVAEEGQPEKKEVGLYKAAMTNGAWKNNANKAYLPTVSGAATSASLRFDFGGNTTGVEEVETEVAETVIYDLTGRRVNEITKAGVYVVNGKKVLVK